jgi:MarR family transcriptional regulator for hemolysin
MIEPAARRAFALRLAFVARRWRNLMNQEMAALGQSQARWGTLFWINVFGESVNQTQLADRIGIEQPTLGRVLRSLEKDGLIERVPGRHDRRTKVIRLTAAAKPLMDDLDALQDRVRRQLVRGIDVADLTACMGVFARVLANMEKLQ